jgi:thioredoxin reductase (NADPH)
VSEESEFDVVIVGGGAAGLSAAVMLGRSRRSVLVLDAGEPRNAPSPSAHNLLGREGVAPLELLAAGRAEAESYGVQIRQARAVAARREDEEFVISTSDGAEFRGRRLLLASGLVDELPDVPGLERFWGTSVLHCPYCHGWEVRDQRVAVLASSPNSTHQALLFSQLTDSVTFVALPGMEPTAEDAAKLQARGVAVITGTVVGVLEVDGGLTGLAMSDGRVISADAVVVAPRMNARSDLFEQLGGQVLETPMGRALPTDETGRTPLPGVWAAGNSANLAAVVAVASAAGVSVGAQLNADLLMASLDGD